MRLTRIRHNQLLPLMWKKRSAGRTLRTLTVGLPPCRTPGHPMSTNSLPSMLYHGYSTQPLGRCSWQEHKPSFSKTQEPLLDRTLNRSGPSATRTSTGSRGASSTSTKGVPRALQQSAQSAPRHSKLISDSSVTGRRRNNPCALPLPRALKTSMKSSITHARLTGLRLT